MLGHASAAMTLDTYVDLFDDDLEAVADALDRAAAGSSVAIVMSDRQSLPKVQPLDTSVSWGIGC